MKKRKRKEEEEEKEKIIKKLRFLIEQNRDINISGDVRKEGMPPIKREQ